MSLGHADLPQGFPQPLTVSMLRGAPAESSVGLVGLREIIPMGPDLGSVLSLPWLQDLWMLWGLVAPLPGLVPRAPESLQPSLLFLQLL